MWTGKNCEQAPTGLAAKTWRWTDDTTIEFALTQGIRFHNKPPVNGREFTAEDVIYSFEVYRNYDRQAPFARKVKSISALGKDAFRMELVEPWGSLIPMLFGGVYGLWISAPGAGGPGGEWWEIPEKSMVGIGPFNFEGWLPGVKWTMTRNPGYFQSGLPYLERIEMLVMPDASTRLAALASGIGDFTREISDPMLEVLLKRAPASQVVRCPGAEASGGANYFMRVDAPPFNDVRVRRAVSMAIERQSIIKNFFPYGATYPHVTSPAMLYGITVDELPSNIRQYWEYHPDKARQLLAEAGYPNGFDTVIIAQSTYGPPLSFVHEAVASMLKQVGIRAVVERRERGRYFPVCVTGPPPPGQGCVGSGPQTSVEEVWSLASMWSGGSRNLGKISNKEFDRLYETYVVTSDEANRRELARQMQLAAAENVWRILLALPDNMIAARPGLHFTYQGNSSEYSLLAEAWWE